MAIKTYVNGRGEIFGEVSAGARRNYVRDALGSVVAETDSANAKLYSARYKPYGSTLTSAGTEPSFTWVGTLGYRKASGVSYSEFSVRARFYSSKSARWTRVDPLWPDLSPYEYCNCSPTTGEDGSGLGKCKPIIDITLDVNQCSSSCLGFFGKACSYTFEYMLNINVTTRGCKNCRVYQWVCEPQGASWLCEKDDALGWPYGWLGAGNGPCSDPVCTTYDQPGISGNAFCASYLVDHRRFLTSIVCDGFCVKYFWGFDTDALPCPKPSCKKVPPQRRSGLCPPYAVK